MKFYIVGDRYNSQYYTFVKHALRGNSVEVPTGHYDLLQMHLNVAKKLQVDAIILSHPKLLKSITLRELGPTRVSDSLQNWSGASFTIDGLKIIISRPFAQLVQLRESEFLLRWYVRKHFLPQYPDVPEMKWQKTDASQHNITNLYEKMKSSIYIAVDIETYRKPVNEKLLAEAKAKGWPVDGLGANMKLQTASNKNSTKSGYCVPIITMIGYCGLFKDENGKLDSFAVVLNINTMADIKWMRKFNALPQPKICQNGGYESTHLIRYNAPLYNWTCDTFHLMHSWFAELPRNLSFISSMFMKNYQYWKDQAGTDMELYNAKDVYFTLWSWVAMVSLAPKWATDNYLIEFRKCFPAITCGLEGFLVDRVEQGRLREEYTEIRDRVLGRLQVIVDPEFNPGSPKQVLILMNSFSHAKFKKSDKPALAKWASMGELQLVITDLIGQYREANKKLNTYINTNLLDDRLLYEINHGGTDTARASSKASNLWVGTQIQNQDNKLRSMYIADRGWLIANCDGSQAESRCTAYISEDATLIDSVENAPDFHTRNASLFFGIPEDEIVRVLYETVYVDGVELERPVLDTKGNPVKDKSLRSLSKRVNHGANYNMAAFMLLQTMGVDNVLEAQRLLKLSAKWSLLAVTTHLLELFEKTYPDVKGKYYDEVIEEIKLTGLLTTPVGWTRKCFDAPSREKRDKLALNKYVAHKPQCTSVMIVDEAEFDFWYRCQIVENKVRLKAQVHDEVVYMVRPKDYEYTRPILAELMARPVEVNGRTMIIPNDGGSADQCWGNLKD
jgi:DNA polymerase I-like protein with 3'-5' exonuclease and polymerase domains